MAQQDRARQDAVEDRSRRRTGVARDPGTAPVIPDKLYFRIGEAARLCGVPSYVLRFWEREFAQLRPGKGGTGQRLYRRRDVEMVLRIKALLYDEGYTIPGARQLLRGGGVRLPADGSGETAIAQDPQMLLGIMDGFEAVAGAASGSERLGWMRAELGAILELLAGTEGRRPVGLRRGKPGHHVPYSEPHNAGTLFDPADGARSEVCRTGEEDER